MAKTTGKRSVLWTVISVIVVLLVVVAVIGLIVHFTSDDKPPGGETFAVKYNGQTLSSGSSVGLMDTGVDFTVEGSADYEVNVYAYCTPENDFSLTVGEEPYTWGDFDGRNVTAGFDFERTETGFTVTHYGLNDIISRVQNGMTVTSETFPTVDMFRMEVKSGEEVTELYFCVNAEVVGITIDHDSIIF